MPRGWGQETKAPETVSSRRKSSRVSEQANRAGLSGVIRSDVSEWLRKPFELLRPGPLLLF